MSAVENGDSVIPMLSDRSFDMQNIVPHFAPRETEKIPVLTLLKAILESV